MLTIALALDFFFRRCILAVVTTMLRMFRNRTTAFASCTLFSFAIQDILSITKRMGADGLDLAAFRP